MVKMKVLWCLAIFVFTVKARTTSDREAWLDFKNNHQKYYRSLFDETTRFSIFQENLRKIEEHNALYEKGLIAYNLTVTKFADMSQEEFQSLLGLQKSRKPRRDGRSMFQLAKDVDIPTSIDWREKGAVTGVKDQGQCGACWAFSVTGSLEGQFFLKNQKLVSFSEQQLVDCATENYGMEGCRGGQFDPAFDYIKDHGLETESSYPFEMFDDACRANNSLAITKIHDYIDIPPNDEAALMAAVGTVGPVSVAIDATELQFYHKGIYGSPSCSQTELNHGVLAVGYGSQDGTDYWIVKNSWGEVFGLKGYVLIKRGVNQCGIALQPSYPVL